MYYVFKKYTVDYNEYIKAVWTYRMKVSRSRDKFSKTMKRVEHFAASSAGSLVIHPKIGKPRPSFGVLDTTDEPTKGG